MTTDERLDRLTGIVDALATSVVAHDNQIEALIRVGERHDAEIQAQRAEVTRLVREWQAYLTTLRKN